MKIAVWQQLAGRRPRTLASLRMVMTLTLVISSYLLPTHRLAWAEDTTPAEAIGQTGDPAYANVLISVLSGDAARDLDEFAHSVKALTNPSLGSLLATLTDRDERSLLATLFEAGVPVDTRDGNGWTPLMVALLDQNEELATLLIERGADASAVATDGVSVRSLAEAMGSRIILYRLAEAGGDATAAELLSVAARTGDSAGITYAVDHGASPDTVDEEGMSPLTMSIAFGHPEIARSLLAAGANPSGPDGSMPPAAVAVMSGDGEALKLLLEAGADPNGAVEDTPLLMLALASGNPDLVPDLLERGADPTRTDGEGVGPAELAAALGLTEVVVALGGVPDRPGGATLEALASAIALHDTEEVELLLKAGAPVNGVLPNGLTPLHVAIIQADRKIVKQLVEAGADPSVRTPDGDTPLILAVRSEASSASDRNQIISTLVRSPEVSFASSVGVEDPEATTLIDAMVAAKYEESFLAATDADGRTALMHAAMLNHAHILGFLAGMNPKAIVDIPDPHGIRPLIASVLAGHADSVSKLLQLGAARTHPSDRFTPQDIARQKKHWSVLAVLPDDRRLPVLVHPKIRIDDRKTIQRKLEEWGYYAGPIDGVLGAGSAAAFTALLLDRKEEILAMTKISPASGRWRYAAGPDHEIWYEPKNAGPTWFVYKWKNGHSFIGHSELGQIRNGFGLYQWPDGSEQVMFLGPDGLKDGLWIH